ncbi:MAG: carboxypeptidase-like regulatory domain-containing protein [Ignavibacteriales bacterium]|nr:MAG: carboxypeptidase-like regulatory domain-containing protein [Ignavibacteriales bacterium]
MIIKTFLHLIILTSIISAQQFTIKGKIVDENSKTPLSFVNIRVAETTLGTSSNSNGEFELKLAKSNVMLIASYIGYYSDSLSINVDGNKTNINFNLKSTDIVLSEVIVKPGVNPALEIIRKAIEKKNLRNNKLKNYEVEAYTKGLVRTTEEISAGNNSIGVGIGGSDTTELIIAGILENHSQNYFLQPDKFKSIILARKQSANFPPSINTLTGGRLIQNFYDNDVNFLGRDLPGPISDNALDYYYFRIENITAQNDQKIYQIYIEPDNSADPGFSGKIFITDSTFDLVKVDLILNRAANTGNLFDTVNVFQQFDEYNGIVMPVDYRLFVKANLLGLVRFGFELNTIMFNYSVNSSFSENIFDKAIVTVVPDADNIDSMYWQNTQTIPNTIEEQIAYNRIDSVESIPKSFLSDYSFLDTRVNLNDNLSITAPIAMYHFSRVEGHALDFGVFVDDAFNRRFNSSLKLSYGFSDKKFKQDFSAGYLLGDYRTWEVKFRAFNKLKILFEESDNYGELLSTLVTLIAKEEFRDYYYTKGFEIGIEGEVIPILTMRARFKNQTDKSAFVNTDFSFFNKEKEYNVNPSIYESRINSLNIGFDIDFRDYIEDGFFRRRTSLGRSYVLFSGDVTYSNPDFLGSELNFTTYEASASAFIRTFKSAFMNINLYGRLTDGVTPYQDLYSLPGNIDVVFNSNTFRTLSINEIIGDKIITLHLTHDFRDEICRGINIPGLKNWEIMWSLIFNAALADITPETSKVLTNPVKSFKHPFYELGFGLGQGLLPFKLEFMWKLNYRDGNNFRVGLNMPLL